jgi:hypothetical protein
MFEADASHLKQDLESIHDIEKLVFAIHNIKKLVFGLLEDKKKFSKLALDVITESEIDEQKARSLLQNSGLAFLFFYDLKSFQSYMEGQKNFDIVLLIIDGKIQGGCA